MSKIIRFQAENIKRLRAVEITPEGNLVVIGGDNAQGKTSILDAIAMALGGMDQVPTRPIRDGESKGRILLETDSLKIERTFTAAGGSTLTVKGADGVKMSSPQAVLDALTSHIAFDPLEFARMDGKKQAATLRDLCGVDVSAMDAERQAVYDERTLVNRDLARVKALAESLPRHDDAPSEIQSASAVLAEIESARAHNAKKEDLAADHGGALIARDINASSIAEAVDRIAELLSELEATELHLAQLTSDEAGLNKAVEDAKAKENAFQAIDTAPLVAKLDDLEAINQKVRDNVAFADATRAIAEKQANSDALTAKLDEIDKRKAAALAKAKLPIKGLAFDSTGVTYRNVPFEQSSAAERLRVSMAMSLAMNPKLKVCLIRDGSLLDNSSLAMVAEMAGAAGAQVWLERVGDGAECQVIIEDGSVKETHPASAA
jgi:DNA repair exonuclease SbcCD ATPase subunit